MINEYPDKKCRELIRETRDPESILWQMVKSNHPGAHSIKFELDRKDIIWREMDTPKQFADQMISGLETEIEVDAHYDLIPTS